MTADEVMALIRASDKPHYCYILKRPNGEPFYVGVGTGYRVTQHVSAAKSGKGRDHRLSIIRKVLRSGSDILYEIAGFFSEWKDAAALEVETIARIGRHNKGLGPLANLTDGGEGTHGRIVSDEQRKILSGIFKGRTISEEQKHLNSVASKKNWQNPDIRARNIAATKAAMARPEIKEKTAEANRVAWESPERLAAWGEAMRVRWRDPERRKAMIAGRGTPVFFNGTQYASVREAAEVEGYGKTTIRRWVAAGLDAPPPKKKRVVSAETRAKIGAGHKGKTLSDEAKTQISAKLTGRKNGPPSEETRRKIGDAHRGLKRSEEVRQNISVAQRARFERERANGGITYPPRTPEQRAKHRKPIEINGVRYDGTDVAVAALGVGKTTIKRWLTAGTHGARRLELKEAA